MAPVHAGAIAHPQQLQSDQNGHLLDAEKPSVRSVPLCLLLLSLLLLLLLLLCAGGILVRVRFPERDRVHVSYTPH